MLEYRVQDMTCQKCEKLIQDAVYTVDTAAEVDIDLDTKTVSIISGAGAEHFENELRKAGFTPEPVSAQ